MKELYGAETLNKYGSFSVEVFWVVAPCSAEVGYQSFGKPRCLNLHFTLKMVAAESNRNVGINGVTSQKASA
jgi:hypothetical protein